MLRRLQHSQLPYPPLETVMLAKVPETRELPRRYRLRYSPSKDPLPRGRTSVTGLPLWQRRDDDTPE